MPHTKVMYFRFYLSLIYTKRLQSDGPKCQGMLADLSHSSVCKTVSKTIPISCENRECPGLSYNASIPHLKEIIKSYLLIKKIRTFDQLIGILWSYFNVWLGSTNEAQPFGLSLCNLLRETRLLIPRMKGDIHNFHMMYDSLPLTHRLLLFYYLFPLPLVAREHPIITCARVTQRTQTGARGKITAPVRTYYKVEQKKPC